MGGAQKSAAVHVIPPTKVYCCWLSPGDKHPCGRDAMWEIIAFPFGQDDYTHSCTTHVGDLLSDANVHHIHRVD